MEVWNDLLPSEIVCRLEEMNEYIMYWCEYICIWCELFSKEMEVDAALMGWSE